MKIVDVDNKVWERKRSLDKELEDLLIQAAKWPSDKTKEVQFEKPQKSLRSILKRIFIGKKNVMAKMIDKDPKRWFIMLTKIPRKRAARAVGTSALNGA